MAQQGRRTGMRGIFADHPCTIRLESLHFASSAGPQFLSPHTGLSRWLQEAVRHASRHAHLRHMTLECSDCLGLLLGRCSPGKQTDPHLDETAGYVIVGGSVHVCTSEGLMAAAPAAGPSHIARICSGSKGLSGRPHHATALSTGEDSGERGGSRNLLQ